MFFMIVGVSTVAAIPLRIVDCIEKRKMRGQYGL
nr:MAG TPA: TMEM240 family [Caudoviricetes sp.]